MKGRHEGPVEIGRRRYGPDVTFLGVPRTGLGATGLDVVFIGAPYDGGTSHRPGPGWGRRRSAPRITCRTTRPRPHLALGVDPLAELRVADAWNVLMSPGETKESLRLPEADVHAMALTGAIPVILGGNHTITLPDATGEARHGHRWAPIYRRRPPWQP